MSIYNNTMKKYLILITLVLITALAMSSCNTYRWQRKRYYQKDPAKNWNYYKKQPAKAENKN